MRAALCIATENSHGFPLNGPLACLGEQFHGTCDYAGDQGDQRECSMHSPVYAVIPLQAVLTCKTCKWWGREWPGCCDFINTLHAGKPETRFTIEAAALDDSDLVARLRTGPDFGCIHHDAEVTS